MDLYTELVEFHNKLKSYKALLHSSNKEDENKRTKIEEQREHLVSISGRLIPYITELTGENDIVIHEFGKPRSANMWVMGLREEFDYRTGETLNACIDNTNRAISQLNADIEMGIRDKQGRLVEEKGAKTGMSGLPLKAFNVKENWESIESEFGITKNHFGRKMNFITDNFKRTIIFRDVEHAFMLASLGFSKPAVILAGGVIEELLRLYLEYKGFKPIKDDFDGYIQTCEKEGLLKRGISRLSDSARHFRNLVHISKEETRRHSVSKSAAKGAVASIFTIANDF